MTKRHFIALADAIREHNRCLPKDQFSHDQLATLADFCRSTNTAFLRNRWLEYIKGECGPNGGAIK
jgi:hypothetical protein